jgi:hypothetical protein
MVSACIASIDRWMVVHAVGGYVVLGGKGEEYVSLNYSLPKRHTKY